MSSTHAALAAALVTSGMFSANAAETFVSGLGAEQAEAMLIEIGPTGAVVDLRAAIEEGARDGAPQPLVKSAELHDTDRPSPI